MENRVKILIADGNEEFCAHVKRRLEQVSGYEIVGTAADGQRAFVRGVNRVVVEQDAAAGDADRVRGEAERRADHRDADVGPGEPHASVEFRPLGSAARVDPGLKAARKAEQVGGVRRRGQGRCRQDQGMASRHGGEDRLRTGSGRLQEAADAGQGR